MHAYLLQEKKRQSFRTIVSEKIYCLNVSGTVSPENEFRIRIESFVPVCLLREMTDAINM